MSFTFSDVPGAPEKPKVTGVDSTEITITWSPPKSDGGSPITGYVIEKRDTSSTRWTKAYKEPVEETTMTIKDLFEGKTYEFRVAAVNKAGQGPFSEPSEPKLCKPPYGKFKCIGYKVLAVNTMTSNYQINKLTQPLNF